MNGLNELQKYIQSVENETETFLRSILKGDGRRNGEQMPLDDKFKGRLLSWTRIGIIEAYNRIANGLKSSDVAEPSADIVRTQDTAEQSTLESTDSRSLRSEYSSSLDGPSISTRGNPNKRLHFSSESSSNDSPRLQCPVCNYSTPKRSHLKRHSNRHTDKKPFTCEICGLGFILKESFKKHMQKHGTKYTLDADSGCPSADQTDTSLSQIEPSIPEEAVDSLAVGGRSNSISSNQSRTSRNVSDAVAEPSIPFDVPRKPAIPAQRDDYDLYQMVIDSKDVTILAGNFAEHLLQPAGTSASDSNQGTSQPSTSKPVEQSTGKPSQKRKGQSVDENSRRKSKRANSSNDVQQSTSQRDTRFLRSDNRLSEIA